MHPIVHSIATTLGSTPDQDPAVGRFLMLVGNHANLLSASMFLTGKMLAVLLPRILAAMFINLVNIQAWLPTLWFRLEQRSYFPASTSIS